MPNHTQEIVVDDQAFHRELVDRGGGQFFESHLEAAVSDHGPHFFVRTGKLRADRRWKPEAHGSGSTRADPMPVEPGQQELSRPHLVLSDIGRNDRSSVGDFLEHIQDALSAEAALSGILERVLLSPLGALAQPLFGVGRFDTRNQVLEDQARISLDRDIRLDHLVEFSGIDVDVDLDGIAAELVEFSRNSIIPSRTDGHDEVTVHHRLVGIRGAVHAEHSEVQGMGFVGGSLAEERIDHRRTEFLGEGDHGLSGRGNHGALTHVKQRPAGGHQLLGGFGDFFGVAPSGHLVPREVDVVDKFGFARALGHVLREVDQYRSRSTRGGDMKRLPRHARDFLCVLDEIAVLDDRVGDARNVSLLEGILAEHGSDLLAAEDDDRRRVHVRRQEPRHRVGCARAGRHENDAGFPRRPGVAVRHVGGALFVPNQDQLDVRLHECVEDGHRSAAGQSENVFNALAFQALD